MKTNFTSSLASALVVAGIISQSVLPASAQIAYPATPSGETERGAIGDYVYQLRQQAYPNTANGVLEIGTLNPTKVGIGTATPSSSLNVASDDYSVAKFQRNTVGGAVIDVETSTGDRWNMGVSSAGDYAISETGVDQRLTIQKSTGNIGVGTVTPSAKVDIVPNAFNQPGLKIASTPSINATSVLEFDNQAASNGTAQIITNVPFSINGASVGIGTTVPTTSGDQLLQLDVEGAIGGTHFCDEDGNNCTTAAGIAAAAGGAAPKFVDGSDAADAVYTSGDVGIGTTTPAANLQVVDATEFATIEVESGANGSAVIIDSPTDRDTNLLFQSANSNRWNIQGRSDTAGADLEFDRYDTGGSYLDTPLVIDGPTGNVGVGTAVPADTLHVNGKITNFAAANDAILGLYANNNSIPTASFKNAGGTSTALEAFSGDGTGNDAVIRWGDSSENIHGVFTDSGNVGIGTTDPNVTLDVAGAIRSTDFVGFQSLRPTSITGAGQAVGVYALGTTAKPTAARMFGISNASSTDADPQIDIQFWIDQNNDGFNTDNERVLHLGYDGNVGVGTIDPSTKLHVGGGARFERSGSSNFNVALNTGNVFLYSDDDFGGARSMILGSSITSNTQLRLEASGNVGIGKFATSGAKLQVEGNIQVAQNSTTCVAVRAGEIRFDGTNFFGCNGSAWVQLDN